MTGPVPDPGGPRLDAVLAAAARRTPTRIALVDETCRLTYRKLLVEAEAVARCLERAQLQPHEPVVVPVSNRAMDLVAYLGVWLARGVVVPLHRGSSDATADDIVARTGARFVVNAAPDLPVPRRLAGSGLLLALERPLPPPRAMLADAALVVFTSGSTGEPKGVVHGHGAFAAKLDMIDGMLGFAETDTTLLVLQLTFIFAQWVALLTLLKGGTVVLHERFRAERVAEALGQGVTRVALVPTMIRALRPLVEGVRCPVFAGAVMAGGEPLPAELGAWLRSAWPTARLSDLYGTTETCACDFFVQADDYDAGAGSIGRPGPGIGFRIAQEDAELQIRSPFAMRGYLDAPELTRSAFADGYFRTGDQARIRADGRVELIGRLKELVNRGGVKISPLEVERAFAQHPDIAAVLAAGIPDAQTGESLVLAIVPRAGAAIDTAEVLRWAASRLERSKLPGRIIVADELPTGRTGKADRAALRELAMRERE